MISSTHRMFSLAALFGGVLALSVALNAEGGVRHWCSHHQSWGCTCAGGGSGFIGDVSDSWLTERDWAMMGYGGSHGCIGGYGSYGCYGGGNQEFMLDENGRIPWWWGVHSRKHVGFGYGRWIFGYDVDAAFRKDDQAYLDPGVALLKLQVPPAAQIVINGSSTKTTGEYRQYRSTELQPGSVYSYRIQAVVPIDQDRNHDLICEKTIQVQAGKTEHIVLSPADFNSREALAQTVPRETSPGKTTLTLHVPADAQVYLAGRAMKTPGTIRTFSTTVSTSGEAWKEYPVKVVVTRNGREYVQEKTVSLQSGETRAVSFDFQAEIIASKK